MTVFQAFILGLVQGVTEFLPISSSAHLILVPVLVDWPDQGLAFDVAVHFGTLSAVVAYFREELMRMTGSWLRSLAAPRYADDEARLAWAGPDMSTLSSITARQMETWAHGQAIFDLLDQTREESDECKQNPGRPGDCGEPECDG